MKRGKRLKKKGSIEMSFQFIFSIILVAVVLFVGFFVIKMFLDRAEQYKFLDFVSELKGDSGIWGVWAGGGESSIIFSAPVSTKVKYVCFANPSNCQQGSGVPDGFCSNITRRYSGTDYNFFYYPLGVAEDYKAKSAYAIYCNSDNEPIKKCVDISKTPICIKAKIIDGTWKIRMRLSKQNETSPVQISSA